AGGGRGPSCARGRLPPPGRFSCRDPRRLAGRAGGRAPQGRSGARSPRPGTGASTARRFEMTLPYEIHAIKYAMREARRPAHFVGGDPHDTPMPMDYFVWLVRNDERTLVVDTGFTEPMARKRGRTHLRCPTE